MKDASHEMTLERTPRLACAQTLGATSLQIGARRRVRAALGERDHMEEHVEPAVAAAVEAVADGSGRRGLQRCDRCSEPRAVARPFSGRAE